MISFFRGGPLGLGGPLIWRRSPESTAETTPAFGGRREREKGKAKESIDGGIDHRWRGGEFSFFKASCSSLLLRLQPLSTAGVPLSHVPTMTTVGERRLSEGGRRKSVVEKKGESVLDERKGGRRRPKGKMTFPRPSFSFSRCLSGLVLQTDFALSLVVS